MGITTTFLPAGATAPQSQVQLDRLQLQGDWVARPLGGGDGEIAAVSLDMGAGVDVLGIHQHLFCHSDGTLRCQHAGHLLAE